MLTLVQSTVKSPALLVRAARGWSGAWSGPVVLPIAGGLIAEREPSSALEVTVAEPEWLVPGLIDLHAHAWPEHSRYGVAVGGRSASEGVTTLLSQGDLGAETLPLDADLDELPRRLVALNVFAGAESTQGRAAADLDVPRAVAAVRRRPALVWGLSANLSRASCGSVDPRRVLAAALAVAERTDRPILAGLREPEDWRLADQLHRLRSGDVVTYCFRRRPFSLFADPSTFEAVLAARSRGVRFDVGHGTASFSFAVAEQALGAGFAPDTISSDLSALHGAGTSHSLPATMAKLAAAGMARDDVLAAVTTTAAQVLGWAERVGSLAPGRVADVAAVRWDEGRATLMDCEGVRRSGPSIAVRGLVGGGRFL